MNPTSCDGMKSCHPIFQQWVTKGLTYDTYSFTPDLQLVVHQNLTHHSIPNHYVGTILDIKHRQGKTQKMYRLKNEGNRVICLVYDSEHPLQVTTLGTPVCRVFEFVHDMIHQLMNN